MKNIVFFHVCWSSQSAADTSLSLSVPLKDSKVQTFLEGKKTNTVKEKPKVTYSVALVLAFLSAENKNRPLKDLPLASFGRLPKMISSVDKDKVNKWQLCKLKITTIFSYWVKHLKRNLISTRAHVLFSIYDITIIILFPSFIDVMQTIASS